MQDDALSQPTKADHPQRGQLEDEEAQQMGSPMVNQGEEAKLDAGLGVMNAEKEEAKDRGINPKSK